jgi:hypothetical protein
VSLFHLAWSYLRARPLGTLLNVLLLALGVGTIGFVLIVDGQIGESLDRDAKGIDLVVGAKGSAMQLMLAGIFHLDVPTGNIPLKSAQELAKDPLVKRVIPLSIADSFRGFWIIGTNADYIDLYHGSLASGHVWNERMQAVLGATVAARTGLGIGARFVGSHGLAEGGPGHGDSIYTVSGVLKPTGTVLDRLVLVSTESIWFVHEGNIDDPEEKKVIEDDRQVTVLLVQYATPLAAVSLLRKINSETNMQAASPRVRGGTAIPDDRRRRGRDPRIRRGGAGNRSAVAVHCALPRAQRARIRHCRSAHARRASGEHRADASARSADARRARRNARAAARSRPRRPSSRGGWCSRKACPSTRGFSRCRSCGCWCRPSVRQSSRRSFPAGSRRTRTSRQRSRAALDLRRRRLTWHTCFGQPVCRRRQREPSRLGGLAALALGIAAAHAAPIGIVAAENVYGDVAQQIGGPDVAVTSILTNPKSGSARVRGERIDVAPGRRREDRHLQRRGLRPWMPRLLAGIACNRRVT